MDPESRKIIAELEDMMEKAQAFIEAAQGLTRTPGVEGLEKLADAQIYLMISVQLALEDNPTLASQVRNAASLERATRSIEDVGQ